VCNHRRAGDGSCRTCPGRGHGGQHALRWLRHWLERAINKAIYDAEISAEGDGLFTCTIVGEPTVWFVPYENYPGGYYRAAVDMTCT
jgi:hypothetical protein